MKHYLGIDIGTYETKGVVVDQAGRVVASAATPHEMIVPRPGYAEHRAEEDWWGDVVTVARRLIGESGVQPASIRAIGCSAIGPCMLPLDSDDRPLTNGVLYGVDTRAAAEIDDLTAEIGAERLLAECGNALTAQSVGPKILWLKRNRPDVFARTRTITGATSFVVHRLTGRHVVDHYTAANFSPLYRVADRSWTTDLTPSILDTTDLLPEIGWTTDIAGTVTAKAAAETGLAAGTPVIVGTIDAAAEAMSVGVGSGGDMMLMYGSTIFTILPSAEAIRDPRLWYAPWLFPGEHASMAGLATSGTLTHWFRDRFARDLDPVTAFAELAAEAAGSPPGANGLVLLPYFSGERTPIHDPHAKGCLFGLNLTHSRADIYRALIEGIAFATNHILQTYRAIGAAPERLFAVGGGTRNRLWLQATSDIAGLPQVLRRETIGASYGDAFLAAVGIGDVERAAIDRWNPIVETVMPEYVPVYDRHFEIYRRLYEQTRDLMHALDG